MPIRSNYTNRRPDYTICSTLQQVHVHQTTATTPIYSKVHQLNQTTPNYTVCTEPNQELSVPNSGPIFKAKDVSDLQANTGCPKSL